MTNCCVGPICRESIGQIGVRVGPLAGRRVNGQRDLLVGGQLISLLADR